MSGEIDNKRLETFVERVERVADEQKASADDMKEILAEAKASGLEPKYIKRLVKERAMDPEKRQQEDAEWQLYKDAMGL